MQAPCKKFKTNFVNVSVQERDGQKRQTAKTRLVNSWKQEAEEVMGKR